jgi:hypothetical protein
MRRADLLGSTNCTNFLKSRRKTTFPSARGVMSGRRQTRAVGTAAVRPAPPSRVEQRHEAMPLSGEYLAVRDPASDERTTLESGRQPAQPASVRRPAVRMAAVRPVAVRAPVSGLDLDDGPVSAPGATALHAPERSTAFAMFDIDDEIDTPASILELQMEGMRVREEAWPRGELPRGGAAPPSSHTHTPAQSAPHAPPQLRRVSSPQFEQQPRGMLPPAPGFTTGGTPPPMRRVSPTPNVGIDQSAVIAQFAGFGEAPASLFRAPAFAFKTLARKRKLELDLEAARAKLSPDVGLYEAALRMADNGAVRRGLAVVGVSAVLSVLLVVAAVEIAMTMRLFGG